MDKLSKDALEIIKSGYFDNNISVYSGYWTVNTCINDPKSLYIFGDNDIKKGLGGQAIIRNCKNSIGIPTKKLPNNNSNSFYTDKEYENNCNKIIKAVDKIIIKAKNYDELTFPEDGFGTGLAKLPEKAPKTAKFLEDLLGDCFGIDYEYIRKHKKNLHDNLNGIVG